MIRDREIEAMRKAIGVALCAWPFFGLAWIVGWEAFAALGVVLAIVASVFGGVYLYTQDVNLPDRSR